MSLKNIGIGICGAVAIYAFGGFLGPAWAASDMAAVFECDRHAASNNDKGTTAGAGGVAFKDLVPENAKPACEEAYRANPDIPRLAFQLGRVEVKLQNYDRAKTLLEDAIAKGYLLAAAELGLMYDLGKGMPVDQKKALELYELAASGGWAIGMSNAADMYRLGLGVDKNPTKALKLYDRAIALDNVVAMGRKASLLAQLHRDGEDPRPIVTALLRAASRSEPVATVDLGNAYLNGSYGLPVDPIAASAHLERGYTAGDSWGGIFLARLRIAIWEGDLPQAEAIRAMLDKLTQDDDPEIRAQALALLGQFALIVGVPAAQATDLITRAYTLNPENDIVLNARANLFVEMGDFKQADAMLEKAIGLAPDWAPYYARRSMIQRQLGNSDLSKDLKNRANSAKDGQYFLQFIGKR